MTEYTIFTDANGRGDICCVLFINGERKKNYTSTVKCQAAFDAEYKAVLWAKNNNSGLIGKFVYGDRVTYYVDSEYVAKQLTYKENPKHDRDTEYKCKNADLQPMQKEMLSWLNGLRAIGVDANVVWVPRGDNFAGHILEGKTSGLEIEKVDQLKSIEKEDDFMDTVEKCMINVSNEAKKLGVEEFKNSTKLNWFVMRTALSAVTVMKTVNKDGEGFTLEDLLHAYEYTKNNLQDSVERNKKEYLSKGDIS